MEKTVALSAGDIGSNPVAVIYVDSRVESYPRVASKKKTKNFHTGVPLCWNRRQSRLKI